MPARSRFLSGFRGFRRLRGSEIWFEFWLAFLRGRNRCRLLNRPLRLGRDLRGASIGADAGAALDAAGTTERLAVGDRWIPRELRKAVGALVLVVAAVRRRALRRRRRTRRRWRSAVGCYGFGVGVYVLVGPTIRAIFGLIGRLTIASENGVGRRSAVGTGAGSAIGAAAAAI